MWSEALACGTHRRLCRKLLDVVDLSRFYYRPGNHILATVILLRLRFRESNRSKLCAGQQHHDTIRTAFGNAAHQGSGIPNAKYETPNQARSPLLLQPGRSLDERRAAYNLRRVVQSEWQTMQDKVDFSSNDILSWNAIGTLRDRFLVELAQNPDFSPGAGGARLLDGFYLCLEATEMEIAVFHGAETGLIVNSGFEANLAVWKAIPRPGDVIAYDALVHASAHEGMGLSLAMQKVEFAHNDTKSLRETLLSVLDSQPLIRQGKRCVLVAVESVYSMDGDVCPLQELVDVADEVFQGQDNIKFVIDEAHSTGLFGPNGSGFVCELGLESQMAVRVHTFGKTIGATGGTFPL